MYVAKSHILKELLLTRTQLHRILLLATLPLLTEKVMMLLYLCLSLHLPHVVVLPTSAEHYHSNRDGYHYHHLRKLIGRNETQIVFLSLLHLLVYLLLYLCALTRHYR